MPNDPHSKAATPVHYDQMLQITAFSLLALGMALIFISSTLMAQSQYNDAYFFIKRQGVYALLGLGALFLGRSIDYHRYQRWIYFILLLSLFSLVLVFVPGIGGKVRGAARWLRLGPLTLQPSEFAKLAVVLFLAYSLSRKQDKMKYFAIGFLPHMLVAGLFIALILKEPDFGTSVTLGAIVFTMLFVGGTRVTHILLTLSACIPLGVLMVLRDPKKFARVLSFMDPWKHGQDVGYQLKQALLAIGSGGLWGLGPGQSRAKLFYLPDCHTDFILAIFSEEMGFLGVYAGDGPVHHRHLPGPAPEPQSSGQLRLVSGFGTHPHDRPAGPHQHGCGKRHPAHQGSVPALPQLRGLGAAGQFAGRGHPVEYQQTGQVSPGGAAPGPQAGG